MAKIKCVKCGFEMEEGTRYCAGCGSKVGEEDSDLTVAAVPGFNDDLTVAAVPGFNDDLTVAAVPGFDDKQIAAAVPEYDEEMTIAAVNLSKPVELSKPVNLSKDNNVVEEFDDQTVMAVSESQFDNNTVEPSIVIENPGENMPMGNDASMQNGYAAPMQGGFVPTMQTGYAAMPGAYAQPVGTYMPGSMSMTQPNLVIHYSSIHPSVAMVTRLVSNGRKDVYYTGQTIEYTVVPGVHQIIMKIGKKNYSRMVTVPGDGSAIHVYGAYDGNAQISIGYPYVVQCQYPIPSNIQAHVQSHSIRVDASVVTVRAAQQMNVASMQQPQMQQSSIQQPQYGTSGTNSNVQKNTIVISEQEPKVFSPLPIIALVCSLSFVLSFVGFILGIVCATMKKIKLRGMGIAAIPVGVIFTIYGFSYIMIILEALN